MKLILRVQDAGGVEVSTREFGEGVYRIGRSDFCDLILQGKEISRSHVELRVTPAAIYFTNMSGAGRLKLNGERVETGELKEGDSIGLGQYILQCQIDVHEAVVVEAPLETQEPAEALPSEEAPPEAPPEPESMPVLVSEPEPFDNVREFPIFERQVENEVLEVEGALALKTENTAIESQAVVAKLIFTEGPMAGKEIPIQGYEMTMGRSKKVDIFIDDDKLSRKHAKISRVGQGYRLVDLESRNGTYVNGVRVLEHPLNSFDEIELGRSKIKFLILDLEMGNVERGGMLQPLNSASETKSLQLVVSEPAEAPVGVPGVSSPEMAGASTEQKTKKSLFRSKRNQVLGAVLLGLVALLVLLPETPQQTEDAPAEATKTPAPIAEANKSISADANLAPPIPREFSDLTPQAQRKVEGHYNTALRHQERDDFESAFLELKELHTLVPYYKESKKIESFLFKKMKEKQKADATEKAERERNADLQIHIEDGVEYLKQGDFVRAGEAFQHAITLDPQNSTAAKGLRAVSLQIRDIEQLPPEVDPEMEKRKLVTQLMEQAVQKFEEKAYQDTINLAEKVRTIELKGETEYLNQAKQLIDRAKIQQKEEFEPFLIQAKEKFAEGDYNLSRDLCDEMLKRDPSYDAAQECSLRARKQLNRLAKEAYTHGYILESMNRIEEAKQYWNRAKNYARPGDPYYDKIQKKLDNYQ